MHPKCLNETSLYPFHFIQRKFSENIKKNEKVSVDSKSDEIGERSMYHQFYGRNKQTEIIQDSFNIKN